MTPSTLVFLFVLVALASAAAVLWRRALVLSLPFLVTLNGFTIPVGGFWVRLDQLAACVLVIPLVVSALVGARRIRTDQVTWWLGAIFAMNVASSLLHSPARGYSLAQCANLASVWIIYVLLLNFLETRDDIDSLFRVLLWAGILASVIGIGAYGLAMMGTNVGGAEVSSDAAERFTKPYGAYGTLLEPNLFGSFTGAYLVMSVGLLIVAAQRPSEATYPKLMRYVAVCAAAGLVLSFTRAAWLGVLLGLVWVALFAARTLGVRVRLARLIAPIGVALALSVALLLVPGDAGDLFRFKLLNLFNVGSQTALLRVVTYTMALQQSLDHLIVGWGTFTFAPLVAQGSDFQQFENWRNLWIGDYLLLALHDTGVIGLALWCGLLWSIVKRGIDATRSFLIDDPVLASRVFALTAGVFSILISFLSTSGFSLGYPWLLIGLLGAHCRLADDATRAPAAAPVPGLAPPPHPAGAT